MKKIFFLLLLVLANAQGDGLGAEVGVASWHPSMSGDFQYGETKLDLNDNLGLGDKKTNKFYYALLDHPIPIIPNIKIIKTNINITGSKTNNLAINFADFTYNTGIKIDTKLYMDQTDYILYYRLSDGILIPFVHLSVGLAAKHLNGQLSLTSKIDGEHKKDFDFYIPMGYGRIKIDTASFLPIIPLDLEYEILKISALNNSFTDEKYGVSMTVPIVIGFDVVLSAGMRKQDITIDVDKIKANIKNEGYYFGGSFNW